jgi:hypothetical protein
MDSFADIGPPPVMATWPDTYLSARFVPSSVTEAGYRLVMNDENQVGAGGDSGGPTIVTAQNNLGLGIAGVQSTCRFTGVVPPNPSFLPGGAVNWPWVTGISSCFYASVEPVRHRIVETIEEGRFPCRNVAAACSAPEMAAHLLFSQ